MDINGHIDKVSTCSGLLDVSGIGQSSSSFLLTKFEAFWLAGKDLLVSPIAIVDAAILMSLSYSFSLSIYYICIYECVYIVRWCLMYCDTSETFSSMIILQRSGGDCNREVCFIPTWKGEASEALKHSEKAKLVPHPYHPHIIPYLSFHLSFSTNKKHPNLPPNHPHHPLIHPLPATRWRFRLYWRPRWFSKKLRFQEFILSSRSSSKLVVS